MPEAGRPPLSVSVVIVNWNGRAMLEECLRSLGAQTDGDFETIVVDNGSTDGSVEMLGRDFPRVRRVETGENLGFAEGVNRGVEVAEGAWIATLNNDAVADPRWMAELRAVAKAAPPRLGMIQSRVVFKHQPGRTNSTGVLLFANGGAKDRDFDAPVRAGDREEEVFCPTAGAALYRRAMLEETRLSTGVLDRTFFMYFEDVDLGWRCRLAGWSALYAPAALVLHAFQASSRRHRGRFIGLHLRRNRLRMLLKNGSLGLCARSLPRTIFDVCEAVVWQGPAVLPSFAAAARDGLRQRGEVRRMARAPREAIERRWLSPSPPEDAISRELWTALRSIVRRRG
jgi:GT2 family glycosyltransferase